MSSLVVICNGLDSLREAVKMMRITYLKILSFFIRYVGHFSQGLFQ